MLRRLVGQVPVDLDRASARSLARRELSRPDYAADRPGLLQRGFSWVRDRIGDLLDRAAGASPGGWAGLLGLMLVIAVLVVVATRLVGPVSRRARADVPLFAATAASAADHRARADSYAAARQFAEAVRERLRAVVRDLEDRGLIDPRPGRTAAEAARDGGAVLPDCAAALAAAARVFDDIWYGGRSATAAHDEQLRALDRDVAAARAPVGVP